MIDCSTILAGPLCAQVLGDYGADVIKIEHPDQPDGFRTHGASRNGHGLWWKVVARNKRCVTINLKHPEGAQLFERLAADADVVVENFRPGTLDRWGIGWDRLHAINPRLVLVSVTGFGQHGPYRNRPGFGTLAEAMSGFAAITGPPDAPPTLPSMGLADSITGVTGVGAVMMALWHRDRPGGSGEGQHIDLSLLAPMMCAVGPGPTVFQQNGTLQARQGNRSSANAPRNTYQSADQKWLAISTSATSIAERVLRLVGREDLTREPWFSTASGRVAHADELDEAVNAWMASHSAEEVTAAFEAAQAAVAPVYTAEDVVNDEHISSTDMLITMEDPDLGPFLMLHLLFGMSDTPGRVRFTGRSHGADTDEVLEEIGIGASARTVLRESGAI